MEHVSQNKGFTLVEMMVALVILSIGMLGTVPMLTLSIKTNKGANMFMAAEDLIHKEIEFIRTFGYVGLTQANLAGVNDDTGSSYVNTFGGIGANFQFTDIDTTCSAPFTYCSYKEEPITRNVAGNNVTDRYTHKIMVDSAYLSPYIQKVRLIIYWEHYGDLKNIEVDFMVEAK